MEPVAALLPFTFHWKVGDVPPFTAVAVKVTSVPEQTLVPRLEAIETEGVTLPGWALITTFSEASEVHPA